VEQPQAALRGRPRVVDHDQARGPLGGAGGDRAVGGFQRELEDFRVERRRGLLHPQQQVLRGRRRGRAQREQAGEQCAAPHAAPVASWRSARSNTSTGCPPCTRWRWLKITEGTARMPPSVYCRSRSRTASACSSEARISRARASSRPAEAASFASTSWSETFSPSLKYARSRACLSARCICSDSASAQCSRRWASKVFQTWRRRSMSKLKPSSAPRARIASPFSRACSSLMPYLPVR